MLLFLFLMVIFYLNADNKKTEHFENNSTKYNQLKSELASFVGVPENRIDDIQVDGIIPDVKITFKILPRTIDALDEKNLLDVENSLTSKIGSMNYDFTVDGETLKFVDINVSNDSTTHDTEYKKLINKYVDPTLDKQIKHLKNIKNYVKYNNSMDKFYKFNDDGKLILNNITDPETEEANLPSTPNQSTLINNTITENSPQANNTTTNVIESFVINNYKPYLKLY